jgi:hypothetical protein
MVTSAITSGMILPPFLFPLWGKSPTPNARGEPRPRAAAQRRLLGVGSSAWFGTVWTEPCASATALGSLAPWSEGRKPRRIDLDLFYYKRLHAQFVSFEQVCQFLAVDEVNGWCAVPHGLRPSIPAQGACGDNKALISPADHRPTEIANDAGTHCAGLALALKHDLKIDQPSKPQDPLTVDTPIA